MKISICKILIVSIALTFFHKNISAQITETDTTNVKVDSMKNYAIPINTVESTEVQKENIKDQEEHKNGKPEKNGMPEERLFINIEPPIDHELHIGTQRLGYGAGYQFTKWLKAGYNYSHAATHFDEIIDSSILADVSKGSQLVFKYHSVFVELVIIDNRWFELMIPLEAGTGYSGYLVGNKKLHKEPLTLGEASVQMLFMPLRTFGLGGGVGYRFPISTIEDRKYSGLFFNLRARFYFDLTK